MVGVEGAQRVAVDPSPHVAGELVGTRAEEGAKLVRVLAPGLGGAEARQAQPHLVHAAPLEQLREEQDQLGIERRIIGAERLRVDLRELAIAARLRGLVAEERAPRPHLYRLGKLVHPVLDVGPADRRGGLGPERHGASAGILEREHLLLHDVGALPDAAREHLGVLEHRRVERLETRGPEEVGGGLQELLPAVARFREHVEGSPRRAELLSRGHQPATRPVTARRARPGRGSSPARPRAT